VKKGKHMAKKSTTEKTKNKVAGAAKTGADAVRNIAGEAIRAAAVAAAGVALQRTADALRGGARKAESAAPKPAQPGGPPAKSAKRAKRAPAKTARRKTAKKKSAKKKTGSRRRSSR
jgi:hypothetical protein